MQVGFMMQKALGELFILKSTKPLPIIFKFSIINIISVSVQFQYLNSFKL